MPIHTILDKIRSGCAGRTDRAELLTGIAKHNPRPDAL